MTHSGYAMVEVQAKATSSRTRSGEAGVRVMVMAMLS